MKLLPVFLTAVLIIAGCDKNRVFERNVDIKDYNWDSRARAGFEFEIIDTTVLYNIYINVRHADYYQFSNLWLSVTTTFPGGQSVQQRVDVPLANEEGVWFGEGLGDIWDVQHMIQQGAYFEKPGTYSIEVEQLMRKDPLPGIMSIGLRVENTGIQRFSR